METKPILVTGSTGYVGGRLVPQLLQAGYRVRALGRSLSKLKGRPWGSHPLVELAAGDVLDQASLVEACRGCWAAFYLVHSMIADPKGYTETDRTAAQNMVEAAAETGLNRIIYLGGLGGKDDPNLSEHLRSRYEVARILQSGPVPATFLRAAMILGAGSVSFEILRYLVERLPVMITPRWVDTQAQPIGIRNVLNYLQGCLEHEEVLGQTFDIGGPEVVSYRRLFQIYAEEAGLPKADHPPDSFFYAQLEFLLDSPDHPGSLFHRPAPGRRPAQCRHLPGQPHPRDHPPGAAGLPPDDPPGPAADSAGAGRHLLDGCQRGHHPGMDLLRGHALCRGDDPGAGIRDSNAGLAGGGLETVGKDRRENRLVFRNRTLENPGLVRPAHRRDRVQGRPTPPLGVAARGRPGLLAGPGGHPGGTPAAVWRK